MEGRNEWVPFSLYLVRDVVLVLSAVSSIAERMTPKKPDHEIESGVLLPCGSWQLIFISKLYLRPAKKSEANEERGRRRRT